jgi:hypothetical protein
MYELTIRMPDGKYARLKAPARSNALHLNRPMNELATVALETTTRRCASRPDPRMAIPSARWLFSASSAALSDENSGQST